MDDPTCIECPEPLHARQRCLRHYKALHYRENRDRYRANHERWKANNPGRKQEIDRARHAADPSIGRARAAAWRAANPEWARRTVAEWVAANPERKRELDRAYSRRWCAANPDRVREGSARYAARKRANTVGIVDYTAILQEFGMVCHICGGDIADRSDLHFDHVIPLARGGPHSQDNVRPSHAFCNISKGARLLAP